MIYRHGLRVFEACDLRWDDIDLTKRTITVRCRRPDRRRPALRQAGCFRGGVNYIPLSPARTLFELAMFISPALKIVTRSRRSVRMVKFLITRLRESIRTMKFRACAGKD
jgi:integrase